MIGRTGVIMLGGRVATWNSRFLAAAAARSLDVFLIDSTTSNLEGWLARRTVDDSCGNATIARYAVIGPDQVDALADACVTWARERPVAGICCLREEYVEPAGVIADLLALPGPGLRAARVCRNKYLQRRYLAEWSPRSDLVVPGRRDDAVAGWDRFPVVIKPIGRLASSGVQLALTRADLRDCLAAYDPDEVIQFEERTVGPEFSVEALVRDGRRGYTEVTEKQTTEGESPYFVELGHTTPAVNLSAKDRSRLLDAHDAVLQRLTVGTGITHGEYRLTARGPVLTEIAVRPPGDGILALHWLATGTPVEDAIVGLAVGEELPEPAAARRYARQVYLPHQPGVLAGLVADPELGVEPSWFDAHEAGDPVSVAGGPADEAAVRCLVGLKPVGSRLGPLRESADRAAMFVLDAPDPAELDELERRVRGLVHLEVSS